ncbi:hypothetical protein GOBAR_DD09711 [Gossypium barbadense]|nr:hypothetical protein GOBAR_DD09711 [Gossypium barbadense]
MVVHSQSAALDHCSLIKTYKPTTNIFKGIPAIDLRDPKAKTLIVKACEEYGFFKLVNHGVPMEFLECLNVGVGDRGSRWEVEMNVVTGDWRATLTDNTDGWVEVVVS